MSGAALYENDPGRRRSATSGGESPDTDAQLAAGIAAGCERSLKAVFERHGRAVYALALRMLGDASLAEEVAVEVFVCLWDEPQAFDPRRATLGSYLLLDARSRCLDRLWARHRGGRGPEGDTGAGLQEAGSGLDLLPAEQRQVIELAYFQGYTVRQIGVLLDVSEATVCARIDTGLQRLRRASSDVEAG